MEDPTEPIRQQRLTEINTGLNPDPAACRVELEAQYGQVWSTEELRRDFEVIGFAAPYVIAKRIHTGEKGSLEFCHSPRFYFNWVKD